MTSLRGGGGDASGGRGQGPAKRARLDSHDSDSDDDELWSQAVEQEEAIIRSTQTQQQLCTQDAGHHSQSAFVPHRSSDAPLSTQAISTNTQSDYATSRFDGVPPIQKQHSRPGQSVPLSKDMSRSAMPPPPPPSSAVELDQKARANLLLELRKKAIEKGALLRELNFLKTKQAEFCANNCKKQLEILTADLRLKDRELSAQRKKIKELASRRVESPKKFSGGLEASSHIGDSVPIPEPPKLVLDRSAKPRRTFPALTLRTLPDLEVFEDFAHADPADSFVRKHFAKWCCQRGEADATNDYIDRLERSLGAVFERAAASEDTSVCAALLRFLAHVQDLRRMTGLAERINWRLLLPKAATDVALLLALTRFLSSSAAGVALYPTVRTAISDERNWRHPSFQRLLNAVLEMLQERPQTREGSAVAQHVLRAYREVIDVDTDPAQIERALVLALSLRLDGIPIEPELVAMVTRGEAFHHLGDVLKKIIRWQPTLSYTGCPEMMEIADESFRDI